MSQRLILPLNDLRVTAAYKTPAYLQYWGFQHYGYDCTSPCNEVCSPGAGEVVAAGQDGPALTGPQSRLGNVLVIVDRDVLCNDGRVRDLTCRMYHLSQILVSPGDKVSQGQPVAVYGNTGANTSGPHLHVEFDADVRFPCLAYGVTLGGRVINTVDEYARAGSLVDSTVDPDAVWFVGPGQQIRAAAATWSDAGDVEAPNLPQDGPDYRALYEAAEELRKTAQAALSGLLEELERLLEKWANKGDNI